MTKKQKETLYFLGSICLVAIAWVGFNIYHSYVASTVPPSLSIQITEINPNFDTKTIDELKIRTQAPALYVLPSAVNQSSVASISAQP